MPDIYLRTGDPTPNNVVLRDPTTPDTVTPGASVRRYYHGPVRHAAAVKLSKRYYYVDE